MQFNFFWNEYVNNSTSNIFTYLTYDTRPGWTLFFNLLFRIELLNNIGFFWIFQTFTVIFSLYLVYYSSNLILSDKVSLFATFLYAISPYTINLVKVLDFYAFTFVLFLLSNILFIKYIKTKQKRFFTYLVILNLVSLFLDFTFFIFIIIQFLYLLYQKKTSYKKASFLILIALFLFVVFYSISDFQNYRFLRSDLISNYIELWETGPSFLITPLSITVKGLLKYNFFFLPGILFLLIAKKRQTNKFIFFNFIINVAFFLAVFFVQIYPFNVTHPITRMFIFVFYWVYLLIAQVTIPIKKRWIKTVFSIIVVLIIATYVSHFFYYQNKINRVKTGEMFVSIYNEYSPEHIILFYNENHYEKEWSTLSQFSFNNPFLLKAKPTMDEVEEINSLISEDFRYRHEHVNVFYNNLFQYDRYLIITLREHLDTEMLREQFVSEIINATLQVGNKIIFIPHCCNIKIPENGEKMVVANHSIYIMR